MLRHSRINDFSDLTLYSPDRAPKGISAEWNGFANFTRMFTLIEVSARTFGINGIFNYKRPSQHTRRITINNTSIV